jgi:hypothetical protein
MPLFRLFSAGLLLILVGPAVGAEATSQDWPCVQRKVATLTSQQFWDGPSVEGLTQWQDVGAIKTLLGLLMSRRVPIEEAQAAVARFAEAEPPERRDETLKLLFAGLLASTNSERSAVMAGIERFQRRQRGRAQEIERQGALLNQLKERAQTDAAAGAELRLAEDKYNWDVRVFSERQQSLPLACEVPVLIEQRLFALAREIRAHMRD